MRSASREGLSDSEFWATAEHKEMAVRTAVQQEMFDGGKEGSEPISCLNIQGPAGTLTPEQLKEAFKRFGKVEAVLNKSTPTNAYSFVQFGERVQAEKAKNELNNQEIAGKKAIIKWAKYNMPAHEVAKEGGAEPGDKRTCKYHMAGKCTKGDLCSYHHPKDVVIPPPPKRKNTACKFWAAPESGMNKCKQGDQCSYKHVDPHLSAPLALVHTPVATHHLELAASSVPQAQHLLSYFSPAAVAYDDRSLMSAQRAVSQRALDSVAAPMQAVSPRDAKEASSVQSRLGLLGSSRSATPPTPRSHVSYAEAETSDHLEWGEDEVVEWLKTLKINKKYENAVIEAFKGENITGNMLSRLTDKSMEKDLEITHELTRIKITSAIMALGSRSYQPRLK